MGSIGGFGGLFDPNESGYNKPILVSATDGVGTKLLIAEEVNKHDTIGIDLVAMSVNDIIVQGAEPLFFLDYFATGKLKIKIAKQIGKMISTKYYIIEFSNDVIGVEICSAIKNIYAMIIGAGQSLNTSSSLFQKSIIEMKYLTKYFKGKEVSTLGLAGVGDLYVSAAGGRNSKMGSYLGKGFTFKTAKKRFMLNDTVEGEQLAREIAPFIFKKVNKKKVQLMIN